MTKDDALEMALDVLKAAYIALPKSMFIEDAITAIKEALSQSEQEPVEWLTGCPECGMDSGCDCDSGTYNPPQRPCRSCGGTGERFTGIDEAPTSICKPCNGTGQIALAQPAQEPVALDEYDAGLLSDYGGGNVEWWQDYIRAELGRAYEHYQSQAATPPAAQPARTGWPEGLLQDDDRKLSKWFASKPDAKHIVSMAHPAQKYEVVSGDRVPERMKYWVNLHSIQANEFTAFHIGFCCGEDSVQRSSSEQGARHERTGH